MALLRSGSARTQELVAGALINLAGNADNKAAIVSAGAIVPFVAL